MASLREIKDHIGSVRSTLKITSAMKLVASAKLRKAQQAAEGIRPYTEALASMLMNVMGTEGASGEDSPSAHYVIPSEAKESVAIVAVASNSSLCGAFNINVIHKVQEVIAECRKERSDVEVISIGRKVADSMRKAGYPSPADYSDLVGHNTFDKSAAFAQTLIDAYNSGRYSRILFIYNHFASTSSQKVVVETYLPFDSVSSGVGIPSETHATLGTVRGGTVSFANGGVERSETVSEGIPATGRDVEMEYLLEPSREEILATLLPQVMRLRVHTVLLDSIAAEHAARTIAMQTASDNAEDLLAELTLEYNKGRQQKITSEILDLVGGSQQ